MGFEQRRRWPVVTTVTLLLLALGFGVAVGVGQELGIGYRPTKQMQVPEPNVPVVAKVADNPRLVVTAPHSVRMQVALDELTAAQRLRPPTAPRC